MNVKLAEIPVFENELMEYIDGLTKIVPERPQGFGVTATEYARTHRIGHGKARRALDELVKAGKLKAQDMRDRGHKGRVYHR